MHQLLTEGVPVEHRDDGRLDPHEPRLARSTSSDPENNDWLAVNQFTVVENGKNRRPDVLVFVNGLPLGLLELKNPGRRERHAQGRLEPDPDLPHGHPGVFTANAVTRHLGRH